VFQGIGPEFKLQNWGEKKKKKERKKRRQGCGSGGRKPT
jgi:hypothetical protein